jgi:hypothetical protein
VQFDRGLHDGQIKKTGEASNGVNVPLCGSYSGRPATGT